MNNPNTQIQADGTLNQVQIHCLAVLVQYLRKEGDYFDREPSTFSKAERYYDLADNIDMAVGHLASGVASDKEKALINRHLSNRLS